MDGDDQSGAPDWDRMAVVGVVARPHGIRGQMIVNVETDFPRERFRVGATLWTRRNGAPVAQAVTAARFQQDRPVIALDGIADIGEARALAGCELRVPVEDLARLPVGVHYRHDLIGCRVETAAGAAVGTVTDVEGPAVGCRLVVRSTAGREMLVPLAAKICPRVDEIERVIVIDPPAGLLDLNQGPRRP